MQDTTIFSPLVPRRDPTHTLGPMMKPVKISLQDLASFTRQLSFLLSSGLSVHNILNFYASNGNSNLAHIIAELDQHICQGVSLSKALRRYPDIFPPYYIGLVETGEHSSTLEQSIAKLADLLEQELSLRRKITAALTYPLFIAVISFLCLGCFVAFILPSLTQLFANLNQKLPWSTQLLVWAGKIAGPAVFLVIAAMIARFFFPKYVATLLRRSKLHPELSEHFLRLPVIGPLWEKIEAARLLFALAIMLESGVHLVKALDQTSRLCSHESMRAKILQTKNLLEQGVPLSEASATTRLFKDPIIHMIRAGEESAKLSSLIGHLSRIMEEEIELSLNTFSALLEPLIMVVLGIISGFIVIGAMSPTIQLLESGL